MKKTVMIMLKFTGALTVLFLILVVIQIFQNGAGVWNGKTLENQLGKSVEKAGYDDLKNLSKSELMQIFYAAEAPDIYKLKGEYKGVLSQVGVLFFMGEFFTKYIYGEGDWWIGKGFSPCGKETCFGYNIFEAAEKSGEVKIVRKRKMATYVAESNIDNRNSYMIDYSPYNSGLVHIFRDELRKINDELFIGMGYLNFPGGNKINFPFILYGKPGEWVGLTE